MEENGTHERNAGIDVRASPDELREELVMLLPRLRRFARALARDVHDADDLVQIAVERALTRSAQLRPDAPLSSWMFGIVRNAWLDELRARGRRTRLFAPEESAEQIGDGSQGAHADLLAVQDALARLPEEQRAAVALVLIEGLSYKEAAHGMEVPIGTLTSSLARGRAPPRAQRSSRATGRCWRAGCWRARSPNSSRAISRAARRCRSVSAFEPGTATTAARSCCASKARSPDSPVGDAKPGASRCWRRLPPSRPPPRITGRRARRCRPAWRARSMS